MTWNEHFKQSFLTKTEVRMVAAAALCLLAGQWVPHLQTMTAAISAVMAAQDSRALTLRAGITRLTVTAVGGALGIGVILLEILSSSPALALLLGTACLLLSVFGCKLAKAPAFQARIGALNFILVTMTLPGTELRLQYALFRLVSTLFGVLAVFLVTAIWQAIEKSRKKEPVTVR